MIDDGPLHGSRETSDCVPNAASTGEVAAVHENDCIGDPFGSIDPYVADGRDYRIHLGWGFRTEDGNLGPLLGKDRFEAECGAEGVAVGGDGRVLISTAGNGTNANVNVLLLYDPSPNAKTILTSIAVNNLVIAIKHSFNLL